jgi:protein disulfide-isomerase A6
MSRIAGLLASPSLAPTKLDELKVKANILSSFAAQKAGDAYTAAGDAYDAAAGKAGEAYDAAAGVVNGAKEGVESIAQKVKEEL